jgi:hypothetical protein
MPKSKKLQKQIEKKLDHLDKAIQKARDTVIDIYDENNWDYDHYSSLETKLEKALELLKDKVIPGKKDEYGDPIVSEKGILTLLDELNEEEEEKSEDI